MAGAYDDARRVTRTIAARASRAGAAGRDACRQALDRLGESLALRETAAVAGDLDEPDWRLVRAIAEAIGPSSAEALKPAIAVERATLASQRVEDVLAGFGAPVVGRLASLVG